MTSVEQDQSERVTNIYYGFSVWCITNIYDPLRAVWAKVTGKKYGEIFNTGVM